MKKLVAEWALPLAVGASFLAAACLTPDRKEVRNEISTKHYDDPIIPLAHIFN